jgi:hypothetical protein
VWFPDDSSVPEVVLRDYSGPLHEKVVEKVRDVLGDFDADVLSAS